MLDPACVDLSVDLCGLHLTNPLVLASGIWGSSAGTLVRAGRAGAGAVTAKSCSVEPRQGHANPTVLAWEGGLINAVGLSNPGALEECTVLQQARRGLRPYRVPLIASVFGPTVESFCRAAETLARAEPELLELNISCPNVESEFGRPFAFEPDAAAAVVRGVRPLFSGPLLVKLSPNAPALVQVGLAAEEAGADGLTAVNTLGPGMLIDVRARRPILTNRVGGVSGAALRPVALRCVYDLSRAVRIPIIGTGGISTGDHALQMVMAGATAIGIGSVLHREGELAFSRIAREMRAVMADEGWASLAGLRGCAHG